MTRKRKYTEFYVVRETPQGYDEHRGPYCSLEKAQDWLEYFSRGEKDHKMRIERRDISAYYVDGGENEEKAEA